MIKNILILISASYGGGAERLVLNHMRYFDSSIFKLHVITLRKGHLEEDFCSTRAKYTCLETKYRFSISDLLKINRYIKENNIKLLHVHLIEAEFYSLVLKILNPGLKTVITKHNTNEFRKIIFFRIFGKIISMFSTAVICVSEAVRNFIIKYEFILPEKTIIFKNGIDLSRNSFISKNKFSSEQFATEAGITDKNFVLGIVGRLNQQKGHDILFSAVSILKGKIPDLKLLVLGDGELRDSLERKAQDLNIAENIIFMGYRDDIYNFYNLFDILCMPSLWEGLSLVLLEAMSTGTLVIMSDLPNNHEVASSKEGVYFKTSDTRALADKIFYYYNHPNEAQEIKQNARRKVEFCFDFEKNLKSIENLYKKFLF